MNLSEIKIGPSIKIQGIDKILQESEAKVSYEGGLNYLPGFDLRPYQVTLNFTEEEFETLQKRASKEGKKITELLQEYVTGLAK